jgi:nucleotide-binding universal stress UspA family protein
MASYAKEYQMGTHKNILVAVDFSDINRLAVERASKMAQLNHCRLTLLHVIEHFPLDEGPLSSVFHDSTRALTHEFAGKLNAMAEAMDCKKVKSEVILTAKSARFEILKFAQEQKVDLIVVAPHSQGVIGSLGSTATGVVNNAHCDVLAVREPG